MSCFLLSRVRRGVALALATAPLLAACGSSDDSSGVDGQAGSGASGGSGGTTGIACNHDAADVDLGGLYALSARLSFTFASQPGGAVTVCPTDQTSQGYFLSLVKLDHQPGQADVTDVSAVVCTLKLPVISAIVGECDPGASNLVYAGLEFPKALLDAVPNASVGQTTASLSSTAQGATMSAGPMNFSIGTDTNAAQAPTWLMENPGCGMNDNAPGRTSECESSCVSDCGKLVDDDADGWPGVTVQVCGFTDEDKQQNVPCNTEAPNVAGATIQGRAMMNLQVEPLTLTGQALSSCEIAGSLDAAISYNVVGADLYLANTQISVTSAIKSLPVYSVNTDESRFRLVRIDGKHGAPDWDPDWGAPLASCRRIIENQNDLR